MHCCAPPPSQKPAGGFPAQAYSTGPSPDRIEGDQRTRAWEWVLRGIAPEAFPRETAPLAATIQPFEQAGMDGLFETVEGAAVVRHSKVLEVASHLPRDRLPEVREGPRIALLAEPLREVLQSAAQPLL